jgi:hypothetical protein
VEAIDCVTESIRSVTESTVSVAETIRSVMESVDSIMDLTVSVTESVDSITDLTAFAAHLSFFSRSRNASALPMPLSVPDVNTYDGEPRDIHLISAPFSSLALF